MSATRPPLNPRERMSDDGGMPTQPFLIFMRGIGADINAAPSGFNPVALTSQSASIPATPFSTDGDLSAGLYRVCAYAQVIAPAGVASSLQLTISWTLNGITQQFVGTLTNGNLTTTHDLEIVPLIAIDAASPITYALAYVSNPVGVMHYNLYLTLERMAAL